VLYLRHGKHDFHPKAVTEFVERIFSILDQWGTGKYPMTSCRCDSASACGPGPQELHGLRDLNWIAVNEYNFHDQPQSHIPWHDDAMEQSVRNTMDEIPGVAGLLSFCCSFVTDLLLICCVTGLL
jgi:hypothetical protein